MFDRIGDDDPDDGDEEAEQWRQGQDDPPVPIDDGVDGAPCAPLGPELDDALQRLEV